MLALYQSHDISANGSFTLKIDKTLEGLMATSPGARTLRLGTALLGFSKLGSPLWRFQLVTCVFRTVDSRARFTKSIFCKIAALHGLVVFLGN